MLAPCFTFYLSFIIPHTTHLHYKTVIHTVILTSLTFRYFSDKTSERSENMRTNVTIHPFLTHTLVYLVNDRCPVIKPSNPPVSSSQLSFAVPYFQTLPLPLTDYSALFSKANTIESLGLSVHKYRYTSHTQCGLPKRCVNKK